MTHRFPIKEISAQAGLSTATVDRVLNGRAHVSARTKARVAAAIAELEGQEHHRVAKGRTVWVDVVVEAPSRFSREVQRAANAVLGQLGPAVVRPRFALQEVASDAQMVATLRRIAKRGSQGLCLKARDVPAIREAVTMLVAKGIPVITLVTDIAGRTAYAGLDNAQAGRVAAALIARQVQQGVVLTAQSRDDFAGEAARISAFRKHLARLAPDLTLRVVTESGGLNHATATAVEGALEGDAPIVAVYSAGGGNRAIVATLTRHRQAPAVYVAHDLDADNLALLAQGALQFVLHHDLERDMRAAFGHILRYHKLLGPATTAGLSDVQVILPENLPQRFRDA